MGAALLFYSASSALIFWSVWYVVHLMKDDQHDINDLIQASVPSSHKNAKRGLQIRWLVEHNSYLGYALAFLHLTVFAIAPFALFFMFYLAMDTGVLYVMIAFLLISAAALGVGAILKGRPTLR